ncbi:MAG: hypothetical protein KGR17_09650, partial [Acidobacteria bacterium]|nr:hypothetical protein [Acidobacteriota bacterium]
MVEDLVHAEEVVVDVARDATTVDLAAGREHGDVALEEVPVDIESLEVVLGRPNRSVVTQPGRTSHETGDDRNP